MGKSGSNLIVSLMNSSFLKSKEKFYEISFSISQTGIFHNLNRAC